MGLFDNQEILEALQLALGDPERDRPEPHHIRYKKGWRTKLNPTQKLAIDSQAIYKLYDGPRASGKGHLALHELVEFCYRNDNCLGYIIIKETGMGTEGGVWHKLQFEILPEWQEGIGIEFTESKLDPQTKKPYIWVSNRHGGWSQIMMASLPVAHQVEQKVRGREPNIILVDEAQALESDTYFTSLLQQLGRRHGSADPSKIIFVCNPEGPSHWLYKRFFEMPVDQETGAWDDRYARFHIPIKENLKNLPPRYYEDYVLPAVKNDPILKARLVDGIWVDRPDGTSLFADCFMENVHVRGDLSRNMGLLPVVGHPMIVGYDPGAAHTSIHFEQIVQTIDRIYKIIVDEIDKVGQYEPYPILVPKIVDRMVYWEKKMETRFQWYHVADSSAFDQYRASTGSFDVQQFEKLSKDYVAKKQLDPRFVIRMLACPKGEYSREARASMVRDDLVTGSLLISATCPRTRDMMLWLPHDPENRMAPRKKHRYCHNFDSLSYGFFYFATGRINVPGKTTDVKTDYYAIGA